MTKILSLIIILAAGYINNASASWQSYVDENLVGTGYVAKGAIVGLSDSSTWASSTAFLVSGDEARIVGAVTNFPSAGQRLNVGGVNYFVIGADTEVQSIYLKLQASGACICKTNQAAVIGTYVEGTNPANCNQTVEGLADYLKGLGY